MLVRVAPERAIDTAPQGLTYLAPSSLGAIEIGDRVIVPLGRGDRATPGIVVEVGVEDALDPAKLKAVRKRDPHGGRLTPELLELGRWMAGYYCCPLGTVYAAMLPAAVKKGTGRVVRWLVDVSPKGREVAAAEAAPTPELKLTKQQRLVLNSMAESEVRPLDPRDLARMAGAKTVASVNRLVELGLLERVRRSTVHALWDEAATEARKHVELTGDQLSAIRAIDGAASKGFGVHVLFGVTGSGKTEVYLHLIQRALERGRRSIVLVPEISLTPQTSRRFRAWFGDSVAILHSGLTAAQRHHQWDLIRRAEARVVVGARSAVFAPFDDHALGLLIVDEEHDGAYKQDQAPRYHGRDVAIKRAQLSGATVVLGSATPSLETYYNARARRAFDWHELRDRVPGAQLPEVTIVDLMRERQARGWTDKQVHLLGPTLESALHHTLEVDGQAMLLLNRRGYANYISCPDQNCGWVMSCDHCDAAMVFHKDRALPRGGLVRCHHCEAEQKLPERCPDCSKRVNTFGLGTQRIEEELTRKFPRLISGETMLRMDSDTMQSGRHYHEALERFRREEIQVLVGTQMIAKGLDFPNVRLVGVVNADTAINLPDFRAAERTFQVVAQVAGRAGRGARRGRVIVQTFQPEFSAIRYAAAHDYPGFAEQELRDRGSAALPPIGRMARVVIRDRDYTRCVRRASELADRLRELAGTAIRESTTLGVPRLRIRGPAPCPLSRVADHHRQSLEVLSAEGPAPIQWLLTAARNEGLVKSDATAAVDVDPIDLL